MRAVEIAEPEVVEPEVVLLSQPIGASRSSKPNRENDFQLLLFLARGDGFSLIYVRLPSSCSS